MCTFLARNKKTLSESPCEVRWQVVKKMWALRNHTSFTQSLEKIGMLNPRRMTLSKTELDALSRKYMVYGRLSFQSQRNHSLHKYEFHCSRSPVSMQNSLFGKKNNQIATLCICSALNLHKRRYARVKGWETDTQRTGEEDKRGGFPVGGILRSSCASVSPKVWVLCQRKNTLLFHMSCSCRVFTEFLFLSDFRFRYVPSSKPGCYANAFLEVARQKF